METRFNILKLEPEAYKAMGALEKYLASSGIDPGLAELVRLRASQINGCAFCIELHSSGGLKQGVDQKKLFAVGAWWESPLFNEKERAILAATDEITQISETGLTDETYQELQAHFSQNEIAQITMLIGTINIWNRMAISMHLTH